MKQWKEAADDAKECIRLDPTFVKGFYRLASAQLELEEFDAAQATIKQGLALDANNAPLLKVLRSTKAKQKAAASAASNPKNTALAAPMGAPAGAKFDSATSREFFDLQQQQAQTSRDYNTVAANLNKVVREAKMAQITQEELEKSTTSNEASGSSSSYYKSIGKIFLKQDRTQIMDHLKSSVDECAKKETDLKQKLEYLERRLKSQQQNMQELMAASTASA